MAIAVPLQTLDKEDHYDYNKSELTSAHVEAEELINHVGQTVLLHGVVYKIREMSGFAFVLLRTKGLCCSASTPGIFRHSLSVN